jgi:hypothetical protein
MPPFRHTVAGRALVLGAESWVPEPDLDLTWLQLPLTGLILAAALLLMVLWARKLVRHHRQKWRRHKRSAWTGTPRYGSPERPDAQGEHLREGQRALGTSRSAHET